MKVMNSKEKKRSVKTTNQPDIASFLDDLQAQENLEPWEGTLREYLDMVIKDPTLNESAHARLWRMIESEGIVFDEKDEKKEHPDYKFFTHELFGVNDTIANVMQYFKAASDGSEVSRRILLLYGPTSSGKSQFAMLLKEGLERFTRTKEGRVFAIDGCPMHGNPLCAIPKAARPKLRERYGLNIEGDVSPPVAHRLEHELEGDYMKLPVRRVFFSEMNRVGVGTFQPADPKNQNQAELTGSLNYAKVTEFGSEAHPLAFDFNGELNIANRGLMEFIEMLKVDRKFRHVLLTLAQEKRIKSDRFSLVYADEALVAHSVVGDTPIPYRKDGVVGFSTIAELTDGNDTSIEVLAADLKGRPTWTPVKGFHKHQFTGRLIKTIQKNGVVETTWNHSIIGKDLRPFYPEDKKDVLAFRSVPASPSADAFILPCPEDLHEVEGRLFVRPTGNKKTDGEYGKYGVRRRYLCEDSLGILRIICWFATEGHVNEQHAIISQADLSVLEQLKKDAESISTTTASLQDRSDKEDGTSRLHLSARVWRSLLESMCGKYSQNKRLPDFIFSLPKFLRQFVLDELVLGDGSNTAPAQCSEEYCEEFFRFKTTSKMLAAQVSYLAASVGKDFNVYHGYTSTGKPYYGLRYRREGVNKGENRIEAIDVEDLTVYDIECIGNHSFTGGVGNVVCHNTNETEYKRFLAQKEEEALHDRLWVVKFPYNLQLDAEIKIYEKLIARAPGFQHVHISPHTLRVAAMFAVLSRLEDPKDVNVTLLKKMRLYNGEDVDGVTEDDVKRLKEEAEREGMEGISPRYVVNRLSACFTKYGVKYITPIDAIRSIKEGFTTNAKLAKEDIERLEDLITQVVEEYNKLACNEVQKAFFLNFEGEIKNLLNNYIDNAMSALDDKKVKNEWGEYEEPDHRLMRSVEEKIGITESGAENFRQEVVRKMLRVKSEKGEYDYQQHARLREALQKQLFEERSDVIRLTVSVRNPDPDALKRLNEVIGALCDHHGYTPESANELLRYVSNIMAKNN